MRWPTRLTCPMLSYASNLILRPPQTHLRRLLLSSLHHISKPSPILSLHLFTPLNTISTVQHPFRLLTPIYAAMAGSLTSPQPDETGVHESPPLLQVALPTSKPSSRRLPPPCWSPDDTVALIDAYRNMWYSLRRGYLKASHWQEVADAVSARCPLATPAKTAVQCRHKMEKLRKRYRTEIQRSKSFPVSRFISSWVHFKRMDSMEKGPTLAKPVDDDSGSDDDEEDDDVIEYPDAGSGRYGRDGGSGSKSGFGLVGNGVGGGGAGGFRIKIPNGVKVNIAKPGTSFMSKGYGKYDDDDDNVPSVGTNLGFLTTSDGYGNGPGRKRGGVSIGSGLRKRERGGGGDGGDGVSEMVSVINMLADGFVKAEQMKMDMAREIEVMRMDMETKRLKMVLESQERMMEAFTKDAVSDKKKPKRMASP